MRRALLLALLLLVMLQVYALSPRRELVAVAYVTGRIDYGAWLVVRDVVERARGAALLVLVVDTYGGYLDAADRIVREVSECGCRVVSWVPPRGKAVSAGMLVALSAQKLYVGPGSVVGACEPRPRDEKVVEYVKARLRALAKTSDPKAISELEKMVTENRAFAAEEACELGIVSKASSLDEVLRAEGVEPSYVERVRRGLLAELVSLVLDPGVAMIMLIVGVLLLLLEVKAAGFQGWGALGGLMIALALYALNLIGPNLLALTLLALGLALIVIELKKPGIQVFGVAGVALLTAAAVIEYFLRPYVNPLEYAPPVAAFTACLAGFLLLTISRAVEAAKMRRVTLEERLVGAEGYAKTDIGAGRPGVVHVSGEDWTAVSEEEIRRGEGVVVREVKGLTLIVSKRRREGRG